ncbi:30S ribosomal protein S15 [Methanosalsum natronophilum]|uniref:Small ribosomal subunit protein uS15 n=1 Tax=Methanosalsum natronophilum TaxID=768733 RepID=A0A424YQP8_9EURY|nr:30S ribosomal protein S15 [Methanosalsum natronophilum]MCS3923341.1 small subunit ribosomal protein S15 [Methanosalsum natronophilum]RQD81188.1 MAG: 30S ribosomal protein S15 [Methanosalsum natronophilum]
MAKMHTRKKGKSMATRPYRTEAPSWSQMEEDELTTIIVNLWNEGNSTSEIGMILRDRYGIPDSTLITSKKITTVLKENDVDLPLPEDLENLIIKAIRMRKHLALNNHDVHNKRALQNTESKIRRLVKYYKASKVLPEDWKYKPATAEMLITR